MTLTLRGSFGCVMVSLLCCRRCSNGRRANWRGPEFDPRQLRYFVVPRSEQVDVHTLVDVGGLVNRVVDVVVAVVRRVVGVVAVRRVVIVACVDVAGDVATMGFDVGDVAAGGGGRGLRGRDDHPAAGPTCLFFDDTATT